MADDVVGRRNALTQPKVREEVKRAWYSDWENLVEPDGRVWFVFTPWHRDDLSHEILGNDQYHNLVFSVDDDFGSIWPERWPEERLRDRYKTIGPGEYARAFKLQPNDEGTAVVNEKWLQTFDPTGFSIEELDFVLSFDLAISEGPSADFFAVVVLGVDEKNRLIYVFDAMHERLSYPDQIALITREAKQRNADVVIESVSYQQSLVQHLEREEPWMRVHRFRPRVSKAQRLQQITPYMVRDGLLFSENLLPKNVAPARGCLWSELLEFPLAKHDDMVDALSQGVLWIADNYFNSWNSGDQGAVRVWIGGSWE